MLTKILYIILTIALFPYALTGSRVLGSILWIIYLLSPIAGIIISIALLFTTENKFNK